MGTGTGDAVQVDEFADRPSGATTVGGSGGAATATVTVVVADDRPIHRAGILTALRPTEAVYVAEATSHAKAVEAVERTRATVAIIGAPVDSADAFRIAASIRSLRDETRLLLLADSASVADLREAVLAGVHSFLLTTASLREIREAVLSTARGERVVSSAVAMELAGAWRPRSEDPPSASVVTPRELEVLQLLAEGLTNAQIGERLGVTARTVKTHVQNLIGKLDVPDRTGAVAQGFRLGLIR